MKSLKVGLVGCGHISVTHVKSWRRVEGCKLVGVFDLDAKLAAKRAAQAGGEIFETLEALIEACDVVDVCTPPQTHASIALQVVRAGRHLLIEKPLVTDVADWDEIVRQLEGSPSQIAVIHNLKVSRGVQQAKRWVEQGRIGEVIRVRREFLTSPETDRMLVGEGHWSHRLPGGRWFETLPHVLYLTHFFAGPLELDAMVASSTGRGLAGAPADEVVINLQRKRCLATIHFSASCLENRRVFTVQGTEGLITVDVLSDFARLSRQRDGKNRRAVGGPLIEALGTLRRALPDRLGYLASRLRGETPHSRLISAFGLYLQGRGPSPTPFEEVDYVVRNCDLIGREIDRQVAAG